ATTTQQTAAVTPQGDPRKSQPSWPRLPVARLSVPGSRRRKQVQDEVAERAVSMPLAPRSAAISVAFPQPEATGRACVAGKSARRGAGLRTSAAPRRHLLQGPDAPLTKPAGKNFPSGK